MIASLRGKPVARTPEGLVLDVGGVGYLVHATPRALARAEGGAHDRLRLATGRPAEGDPPRGHEALRGDPRDREEDGAARRARAQGEARRCGERDGGARLAGPRGARRARGARLHPDRRGARACRHRSGPAARGTGAPGAEAGGVTTQFLAPAARSDEEELERSLRPRRLDDFVGQERIKEQLAVALEATRARGEALDHVLLVGPPGL